MSKPPTECKRPLRLYLLRHAKSSWADADLQDFDRPLSKRGVRAAALMARFIRDTGVAPDYVICSPSRRTLQTWTAVATMSPAPTCALFPIEAYHAGPETLADLVRAAPAATTRLMIVGHNPGFVEFAKWLDPDGTSRTGKFPTGALANFESTLRHWSEIAPGTAKLVDFRTPKALTAK